MCEGGHALLLERLKSDPRAWSVRMQPITNLIANFACNKFRLRSQIEFGNDCQCDRRQTRKRVDTRLIESSRSRRGKLLGHFFEVAYRLHPHWCHLGRDLASGSLADEASIFFAPQLFVDDFDLLINYLPGKPVNRDVHPVVLLTFDKEACESGSVRRIAAALGYYVNHKVPSARLTCIGKSAGDRLTSLFGT